MGKIKNLVFEGGGVKGIAYGGALSALDEAGVLKNVRRVAGTSAGAITAVLLAVGYSSADLSKVVAGTDFNSFADDSAGVLRDVSRLIHRYGVYKGSFFTEWIRDLIEEKTCVPQMTFAQLRDYSGLELFLTGTNLTKNRVDIFSHETTPDMEIALAARISMGIPIYFQAVTLNGDIMVDGGVSYNYPLNLFDHDKYVVEAAFGKADLGRAEAGYRFNQETLGLRVDSPGEIEAGQTWSGAGNDIQGFGDFTLALVNFLQFIANKKHLSRRDWNRTVFIDSGDVNATDFGLKQDQIDMLLENGRAAVDSYFKVKAVM